MHNLPPDDHAANRPLFRFESTPDLPDNAIPTGQLSLSGPSEKLDAAHWPVRGDLAHIRLAGRCFVPHYAVPMPQLVATGGASLHVASRDDSDVMTLLVAGETFNVLDMAGNWAWGQQGDAGLVGYVALSALLAP